MNRMNNKLIKHKIKTNHQDKADIQRFRIEAKILRRSVYKESFASSDEESQHGVEYMYPPGPPRAKNAGKTEGRAESPAKA